MPQRVGQRDKDGNWTNPRGGGERDKTAESAYDMVRGVLLQRNVKFSVEAIDRGGNFIGHIWLGNKQNLGEELLRRGLAKIRPDSAERSEFCDALKKAESEAQNERQGYWVKYDPDAVKAAEKTMDVTVEQDNLQGKTVQGLVTHIEDACTFYFQSVEDDNQAKIAEGLKAVDPTKTFERVKNGMTVCAKFQGEFYRARTIRYQQGKGQICKFIDYGNDAPVAKSDICACPMELLSIPPTAYRALLAGLAAPPMRSEHFADAGKKFAGMIDGKTLTLKVILSTPSAPANKYRKIPPRPAMVHVSALGDGGDDINREMLISGYARLDGSCPKELSTIPGGKEILNSNEVARKQAYTSHAGMWQYGDPGSDNEDED